MEAEGGAYDNVVLRSDCGRCLEIVQVIVDDRTYAGAIGGGESIGTILATEETGDGNVAECRAGRIEEVAKDGATDEAGSASEEDLRGCRSHYGTCLTLSENRK